MTQKVDNEHLTFSKRLTIVDTISWTIMTILLITVILFMPSAATYCVNMATTITAAYVSLRLGYTGKAAIENYKKINNTINRLQYDENYSEESQQTEEQIEIDGGNG